MKRTLYLLHRWAGIALGLVMALWFVSGMVMLYVGYPKLTPIEQMQGLPVLAPRADCCVPLADALVAAGPQAPAPSPWRLAAVAGQPRYLFGDGRAAAIAVDARTGRRIGSVTREDAEAAASHFAGGASVRWLGQQAEDAWTHSSALKAHRPLHRLLVEDDSQRWLYVSGTTGEVVRDASVTERTWGWLGAWLHWLYAFRGGALNAAWTNIVIYLSLAGSLLALSGLIVGVWRWRFTGRYKNGARSPYRGRMARWHHLFGLGGGILALTWVVSGLFSMNPWQIFDTPAPAPDRVAYAGGPLRAADAPDATQALAQLQAAGHQPRTLEWRRVAGRPVLLVQTTSGVFLLDARGQRIDTLDEATLLTSAARLFPSATLRQREWLTTYDRYYYARDNHTMTGPRDRPLPALRLRFDDAGAHDVVLDPATGALVLTMDSHQRAERWLFAFLHSFDLPAFLAARPAWDAWMLGFSLAGLVLSITGVVMGWRRLRHKFLHTSSMPSRPRSIR